MTRHAVPDAGRWYGLYPAIVVDIVDKSGLGKIKVKLPTLGDGDAVFAWATLLSPYAEDDQGLPGFPSVDTQVIVGFLAGDPDHPFIVGSAWNGKEKQPLMPESRNNKRALVTRSGSRLEFDNTQGVSKVTLSMKTGHRVELDEGARRITVRHADGCSVTLKSTNITVVANVSVTINATTVDLNAPTVNCSGHVNCASITTGAITSAVYSPGAGNNGRFPSAPLAAWRTVVSLAASRAARRRPAVGPRDPEYSHAQFAKSFMAEPQRSLRWDGEADFVHEAGFLDPQASLVGRVGSLVESLKGWGGPKANTDILFRRDLYNARMTPTGLLKLFLPVYERFYLVVCELHCDTGGFPSVAPDEVCSAGFVIRRRRTTIRGEDYATFRALAQNVTVARAELADLLTDSTVKPAVAKARLAAIDTMKTDGSYEPELSSRQGTFEMAGEKLQSWLAESGYATASQRWVGLDPADPSAKAGEWRTISASSHDRLEDEQGFSEYAMPLKRAFAPPDNPDHDATGRSLFFGIVPTIALQHDREGNDRFDDQSVYEIRCFVRRRRGDCLRIPGFAGCRGEVIWSDPAAATRWRRRWIRTAHPTGR